MGVECIKTLIINGSPRKNGVSTAIVNEIIKYIEGDIEIVDTYYDNISPCIYCRYCWDNYGCLINDKMQDVYKLINEVDNVVIASPLYFSQLTGKLLSFASRFQCLYVSRCMRKDPEFRLKRKKGIVIITGGGDGNPESALKSANTIFRQINTELIGTVLSLDTNELSAKEDKKALRIARELALSLNENQ